MNEIKKLFKNSILYFMGNVGSRLVSFALLPLYTRMISTEGYGTFDLYVSYATLFSSFCFLDIWTGIMKFAFEKQNENDKKKVIFNGLLIFGCSTIVYTILMVIFNIYVKLEYFEWVWLYGIMMVSQNMYGYLARSLGKSGAFAISGIISTMINAIVNIVLLVLFHSDYKCLYIAFIVGVIVQCIYLEFHIRIIRFIRIQYFDAKYFKEILFFSLPLCVNSLCYWLLSGYNKVIINTNVGVTANGLFAIAAKFSAVISIVASCVLMAWQELAYSKCGRDEETGKFYSKASTLYLKALGSGFLLIMPIISIIFPIIIGNEYIQANKLISLCMLGTISSIFCNFLGNIVTAYNKNSIIFTSTLVASIINITIASVLIKPYGIQGANIALILGYIGSCFMRMWIIGKQIRFKICVKELLPLMPFIVITLFIAYFNVLGTVMVLLCNIMVVWWIFRKEIIIIFHKIVSNR